MKRITLFFLLLVLVPDHVGRLFERRPGPDGTRL